MTECRSCVFRHVRGRPTVVACRRNQRTKAFVVPRRARGLSLSMLLASLGTSSANVALPTLAEAFDAPFPVVQWIVLAYLLALTTVIVSVGRLGDVTGRRRLLLAGIALFTAASVASGTRADARAADRLPGGPGPRGGGHARPHHGVRRRGGAEGADGQRHGTARNDVRHRHRPRAVARRRPHRRRGLAGDLPGQPPARPAGARPRAPPPARRPPGAGDLAGWGSTPSAPWSSP